MMMGSKKFRKSKKKGKFLCAVCRNVGGSNLILHQIFKCWLLKRCIRGVSGIGRITSIES